MGATKITISLDNTLLTRLDRLVQIRVFPNRSRAIQEAIQEKIERFERSHLVRECEKLDPHFERALAAEGLTKDVEKGDDYANHQ